MGFLEAALQSSRGTRFDTLDLDANSYLEGTELEAASAFLASDGVSINQIDSDDDGKISKEEFKDVSKSNKQSLIKFLEDLMEKMKDALNGNGTAEE